MDKIIEKYKSKSHGFKISVVILLFSLSALRLYFIQYYPSSEIIPEKFLFLTILSILFYLWIQEMLDFHKMIRLNTNLCLVQGRLNDAEIDTIGALIKTVEAKDLYTRGHSERVTKIAMDIAKEMRLAQKQINTISRASILHDIGKIGLSDALLNKKEKLTDEEFEMIKKHPDNAAGILGPLKFLNAEKSIIVQHHERFDGRGYPLGLKSDEISFEAKIISVADAFDAMNSRRAYREALSKEAIISELQKSRGSQHAPEVVDTFLKMLEKKPQLWEK
ncbi:MAG: HD-GYP domain-containing protein [Candidatus Omnitrophica bacterium]|jgi:HD-GYP domain-containing protein (c-di-GMP phosphodiesterase class II)|nr:HD-GYP domain-containing protein [Candidatus Omnitrophota bacterium]